MEDRWCIESCDWLRHIQLYEDDHLYVDPCAALLATLRTLVMNMLGLHGHHQVRAGLAAIAHDIAKQLPTTGMSHGWTDWLDFKSSQSQAT